MPCSCNAVLFLQQNAHPHIPFPRPSRAGTCTRTFALSHICAFAHMQDAHVGPNRGEHSAELGYVNGPESKMLMQEESLALSQPYRAFSRRDNGGGVCQGQGGGLAHSTTIEHNHAGNVADKSGGRLSRKMIHLREDSLPLPQPHRSFTLRRAGGSSLTRGADHSGGENGTEWAGVRSRCGLERRRRRRDGACRRRSAPWGFYACSPRLDLLDWGGWPMNVWLVRLVRGPVQGLLVASRFCGGRGGGSYPVSKQSSRLPCSSAAGAPTGSILGLSPPYLPRYSGLWPAPPSRPGQAHSLPLRGPHRDPLLGLS